MAFEQCSEGIQILSREVGEIPAIRVVIFMKKGVCREAPQRYVSF